MKVEIENTRDGKWLKYEIHHAWRHLDISGLSSNDLQDIINALEKEIGGHVPNVQSPSPTR